MKFFFEKTINCAVVITMLLTSCVATADARFMRSPGDSKINLIIADYLYENSFLAITKDDITRVASNWNAEIIENLKSDQLLKKLEEIGKNCNNAEVEIYYTGLGDSNELAWRTVDGNLITLKQVADLLQSCRSIYLIWDAQVSMNLSILTKKLHPNITILFAAQPGRHEFQDVGGSELSNSIMKLNSVKNLADPAGMKKDHLPPSSALLSYSLRSILREMPVAEEFIGSVIPWIYSSVYDGRRILPPIFSKTR